jgi:hypothetical protein
VKSHHQPDHLLRRESTLPDAGFAGIAERRLIFSQKLYCVIMHGRRLTALAYVYNH